MNEYRTYTCNTIRKEHVGEHIKLAGWIQTIRDLGGVIFIDFIILFVLLNQDYNY